MIRTTETKYERTIELRTLKERVAELEALVAKYQQEKKKSLELEDEQRYKIVFESANDVILLLDNKGYITDVNNKLPEILGYEREKLLGRSLESLTNVERLNNVIARNSLAVLINNFQKRITGSSIPPYEIEMTKKNGEHITLEVNARAMKKDGKIIGNIAILRDVTERKRNEQELREREENLRIMMEASAEGFALHDSEKIIDINDYGASMFGYMRSEMIGKKADDLITPISLDLAGKNINTDYTQPYEAVLKRRNGFTFPVQIQTRDITYKGQVVRLTSFRDLTMQKRYEDLLENIVVNAPVSMSIIQDGKFKFVNKQFCLDTGHLEAEVLSMDVMGYIYAEDRELVRSNILQMFKHERTEPFEFRTIDKNGKIRWALQSVTPITYNGRRATLAMYLDITEQKKTELALRGSEQKYRTLADSITDVFFALDNQLRYVHWNKASEKLTGISSEDALGKQLYDIFPDIEATRRAEEAYLKAINTLQPQHLENKYQLKGKDFIFDISAYPSQDGVSVFVRDVTERKQAEEQLRESEENFKAYLDNAPAGVCLYDLQGIFMYGNNKAEEILGYKKEELIGTSFLSLNILPPKYLLQASNLLKLNEQGIPTGPDEFELIEKDGSPSWVELSTTPIKQKDKILILCFVRDINDRKTAENAMRESRSRFRDLARLLPLSVWETDENGVITYTNDKTMEVYGYSRQDAIPTSYLQNLIPEDRDRVIRNTQKILQGEDLGGIEYTSLRKDGSAFPSLVYASAIVKNNKRTGLRGITVDITGQKMAERRLEIAAQEWRTTFDSITDMVCILDNDFRISRVNMAFANMLHMEPRQLLGKVCYELLNRNCPHADCPHQKTLQTGKPARTEFFEPVLKTTVEVMTSPIFNEKGEVKGSVHIIRDISERKQMEQQLVLTDRLASVGELASGVAHELNNPLTSVIGFSQLLIEGEIPDNIKEDLSLINREAQRAANIVKNLLTFARKHAAVKQATRINTVVEDVLKLRAYEEKVNNIEVIKKFDGDLPEIMVDYFQMQQVFLNLIINAEFFMTEAHHRGTLAITTEKIDHTVRISFADDGPGISNENLKRIFDPFFTTKDVGKGTGLGLSICHGIVAEHNGLIYAQSEVGKGATFIVELPIEDD